MFARYRFAAFAAVSCAGLAGSVAFAQESAKKYLNLNTATNEAVELLVAQGSPAGDEAADELALDAEELPSLWLGVQLATEIPPALAHHLKDAEGALVETVYPNSPAAESGIEAYDLIVRLGEADVESHEKLVEAMKGVEAQRIDVVVIRGSERKTISVTPRERATFQPNTTATAEASDLLLYDLNVPHLRMLPALGGSDAGAMHHRLGLTRSPAASLPENVESMKVHVERDGEKTVHRVEVTTVDGKVFKAANEEELKALPPEIRAILPLPQNAGNFALRLTEATGAPPVQKQLIIQAAPHAVAPPQVAVPAAPAPVATSRAAWVDIVRLRDPAGSGDVAYRVTGVVPPGEELNQVKKELSELRASIERIEKLLREKE